MSRLSQLLCAAGLVCLPTMTAMEVNFAPLKHSWVFQIELPYGVMPHWDIKNPAYGMAGNDIEWMIEKHFDELGTTYVGLHPDAWPDVPPYFPPRRPPPQPFKDWWLLWLPFYGLLFCWLASLLRPDHRIKLSDKVADARAFLRRNTRPAVWRARTHGLLAVELDLLTEHINSRERGDVEHDRWSHQALAAPGKIERSLQAYKFITMEFLLGGEKLRRALRHVQ